MGQITLSRIVGRYQLVSVKVEDLVEVNGAKEGWGRVQD